MASKKAGSALQKWAWEYSGFRKYGLYYDDLANETPLVLEALRRLPEHIRNERHFRQLRATQLNIQKSVLPKDQWTKYEDDSRYLKPYLEQVQKEFAEKEEWGKLY
ncbi:hypothetical protein WDU94_000003 [Cyamophila willieti]